MKIILVSLILFIIEMFYVDVSKIKLYYHFHFLYYSAILFLNFSVKTENISRWSSIAFNDISKYNKKPI